MKIKVSQGILMKRQRTYDRESLSVCLYFAAQRINETVQKPSLCSAVGYYLSMRGRHIEINLFKLPKNKNFF